jgi:hypothetical protein
MKKIKLIYLALISVTLMSTTSCVINDDYPVEADPVTEIEVSLSPGGVTYVPTTETSFSLDVTATDAFTESALIEYTFNGMDDAVVLSGTTSSFSLDMGPGAYYSLDLNSVTVENAVANKEHGFINQAAKSAQVIALDVPAATATEIQFVLSWANPDENDLDLWGADDPPALAWGASQSLSAYEYISMSTTFSDGTYTVLPRVWSAADAVVPFTVTVIYPNANPGVDPDVVESYSSSVAGDSNFNLAFKFVKSGSTFTITDVQNPALSLF